MPDQRHAAVGDGIDLGIVEHVHVGEDRVRAEDPLVGQMHERRAAKALSVELGVARHEVLVLVEDGTVLVGQALGLLHQLHRAAADAEERDMGADQPVGVAAALHLLAEQLARPLCIARRAGKVRCRRLAADDVPQHAVGDRDANPDRLRGLGDHVGRERGRRLDIAGKTVLHQLDRGHQRAGIFVLVGQRVGPAGEGAGTAATRFLRRIGIVGHRAARQMQVSVIVPVDEPGMDRRTARIDHPPGLEASGDLGRRPDRDDASPGDGNRAVGIDGALGIHGQHMAMAHQQVAALGAVAFARGRLLLLLVGHRLVPLVQRILPVSRSHEPAIRSARSLSSACFCTRIDGVRSKSCSRYSM